MTRGLYISIAMIGLLLALAAAFAAFVSVAPPGWARAADLTEATAAVVGVGMAWGGLIQARAVSEYGMTRVRPPRRRRGRDAVTAAPAAEVAFDCPSCGRTYRAAGRMAGLPFACRACDARFTVPRSG